MYGKDRYHSTDNAAHRARIHPIDTKAESWQQCPTGTKNDRKFYRSDNVCVLTPTPKFTQKMGQNEEGENHRLVSK